MRQKRQHVQQGGNSAHFLRRCNLTLRALAFTSSPLSSQAHPYIMATEESPQGTPPQPSAEDEGRRPLFTNEQILGIVKLAAFLALLGGAIYYFVYTAVPEKVRSEVASLFIAKDGPLERLVTVETEIKKIPGLDQTQREMQRQLTTLDTKFDVYFDKTLDINTAEQAVGRAIGRAIRTQDNVQKTVALEVAQLVLDKATSKPIVIDYKKANEYGLAILNHSYNDDQKPVVKATISKIAKQRNLKIPVPPIPKDNQQESKYILGGDRVLDGTFYKDVTFVDSKIIYGDGWLGLENVRFINCTFEVSPVDSGRVFYLALFKSDDPIPSVTVKPNSPLPPSKPG